MHVLVHVRRWIFPPTASLEHIDLMYVVVKNSAKNKKFFFRQQILSRSFTFKNEFYRGLFPPGDYSFALTSDIQYLAWVLHVVLILHVVTNCGVHSSVMKLLNSVHLCAVTIFHGSPAAKPNFTVSG